MTVLFTTQSFPIGTPGQIHLHFYLDTDPVPYRFYNGAGINDQTGVTYNGIHTHFVHWKSATSFDIFGLRSAAHTVRLVLADQNNVELQNPEATDTLNFSVSQPPPGNLQLQPVVASLNFPTSLSLAPDGRVFFSEIFTGTIRIINPQWQLVSQPFCTIAISTIGNQGVLGLALDPNFAANHYVYVFYTALTTPCVNRVVRYTESSGSCTEETLSSRRHSRGVRSQ